MPQLGRSALLLAFPLLAACFASTADPVTGTGEAITTSTRTFLVPQDERARTLCRDEVNAYYCNPASTQAAIDRCLARIGATDSQDPCAAGSSRCLRIESAAQSCAGDSDADYPSVTSCQTPRAKNCSFYSACVDHQTACGEQGYALGYGEKYCTAFKNLSGLSATGAAWRDSVMSCLQQELVGFATSASVATCSTILETAFDSHPRCYTRPEHSICFLPPADVLRVLGTIGGSELLTARSRRQILTTVWTCIGQIGRWLLQPARSGQVPESALGAGPLDEASLRAQLELWTSLERAHIGSPEN